MCGGRCSSCDPQRYEELRERARWAREDEHKRSDEAVAKVFVALRARIVDYPTLHIIAEVEQEVMR